MIDYLQKINDYGQGLFEADKPIARKLFENLIKKGWSAEKVYQGIRLLRGRSIRRYKGLFYFNDFIEEIEEEIKECHENLIDKSLEEKEEAITGTLHWSRWMIPKDYIERFEAIAEQLNDETQHYTEKELIEEVDYLYDKVIVEPILDLHCSYYEWLFLPLEYSKHKRNYPAQRKETSDLGFDLGF